MTQFRTPISGLTSAIRRFLASDTGALTSSFVVMSSAAVTVTTATVLTVSNGAEIKSASLSDSLVQIDPGQALDLTQPPYNFPVCEDAEENAGGTPTIIEQDAVAPQGSGGDYNPAALMEGGSFGGTSGGGSSAPASGGGGGGFSGTIMTGTPGTAADEEDNENTRGSRS